MLLASYFSNMKGTTLGQIKPGGSFWFGDVKFVKHKNSDDEMVECHIYDTKLTVHIANCAWVSTPGDYLVKKTGVVLLDNIRPALKKLFRFKS